MESFVHDYVESVAKKIITPMEHKIIHSNLSKEEQKNVIKEIMVWLLLFAWENDNEEQGKQLAV